MSGEQPTDGLKPDLAAVVQKPWYRDLTRYQWWVLVVASLGWMFDTMDQQFFNLARSIAMTEVLGFDPTALGREALGRRALEVYGPESLGELVDQGLLASEQIAGVQDGATVTLSRNEVARLAGETIVTEKHRQIGSAVLEPYPGDPFDANALQPLVDVNLISAEYARQVLDEHPDGVPRSELARSLGENRARVRISQAGDRATFWFIIGWAVGGVFFGWVGDRIGRAKTMALTILIYAVFTGLNGLAQTELQFIIIRFIVALGVGGEFAAGAALVAEYMPDRSRPAALGTLQAVATVGNMAACLFALFIIPLWGWRWLFAVGAFPALLAVVVRYGLKEPDKWTEARRKAKLAEALGEGMGSYAGLFRHPRWRRNAIIGLLLGVVGVGGLWGVGFFTPELIRVVMQDRPADTRERVVAITFLLQQAGAFLGITTYTWLSLRMGRRPAFAMFFVLAFFVMAYVFLFLQTERQAYYLLPLLGFVTLGPFAGFAIYFPELFPTRLRATGTGFCYNVGRFLAAGVPQLRGWLTALFNNGTLFAMIPLLSFLSAAVNNAELATRYASVAMAFIYLAGLVVLLFAPETRGQPLPED